MEKIILMPAGPDNYDSSHDGYEKLIELVNLKYQEHQDNFLYYSKRPEGTMSLFDIYISFLPDEAKRHYFCSVCKRFLNKYGSIVYIDMANNYKIKSALFDFTDEYIENEIPEIFKEPIRYMRNAIESGTITVPFRPTGNTYYGRPYRGKLDKFNHFNIHHTGLYGRIDDDDINFTMLKDAIFKFSKINIDRVDSLFEHGQLNRSGKFIKLIRDFALIHQHALELYAQNINLMDNYIWYIARAYPNIARIKNSPVGLILNRMEQNEMHINDMINEFNIVVAPDRYQRPTASPTVNAIKEAEKLIEEGGYANSLNRRFANIEDIPNDQFLWKQDKMIKNHTKPEVTIFKDLMDNAVIPEQKPKWSERAGTTTKISITKFIEMIQNKKFKRIGWLPAKIHGRLTIHPLCGILTAVNMDAKPIMKWDTEEARNPFSWYVRNKVIPLSNWNIDEFNIIDIKGIIKTPNRWNPNLDPLKMDGYIFLLDGAKDLDGDKIPKGLFPEMLKSELYPARRVIESYSNLGGLENFENPTAGIGLLLMDNGIEYQMTFIVDDGVYSYNYFIDRFD